MLQQYDQSDSPILGFCLNLECQEQNSYFVKECLTDPQNHNQCKNDCKMIDELEIILEYLIYELKQKLSQCDPKFQQTYEIEMQNYQRIIQNLNSGQYKEMCQDIKYLKIQYSILNKCNNQNKMIEFCLSQGIELIKQQNWNKALQYIEKILKQQSKNSYALFYLSVVLLELNQYQRSQRMFDKLKKEYPKFYEYSIQRTTEQQLKINENDLSELLLFGHSLFENKQYIEAVKISDRILDIDNKNMNALMGKIASLIMLQQFQQAIQIQNECQEKNIEPSALICFQGIFLIEQNLFKEAMACFDKAIQLNPNYVDAYYNKGNLLYQQLKFQESLIYFDKVIQLDPQNPDAYNNKGVSLLKLKKNEEALIYFDKAIQYDPNFELAYNNKGSILFKLKNYIDAINCYDRAIYLDPNFLQPYQGKGESLEALNQFQEAIKYFQMTKSQQFPPLSISKKIKQLKNLR